MLEKGTEYSWEARYLWVLVRGVWVLQFREMDYRRGSVFCFAIVSWRGIRRLNVLSGRFASFQAVAKHGRRHRAVCASVPSLCMG